MVDIISNIKKYARSIITRDHTWQHHIRTLDYLLILNPEASVESQIAAITHDIERSTESRLATPKSFEDKEYLINHGEASANIVIDHLKSQGFELDYTKLKEIIKLHEIGGTSESDQLRDADSLSFLEVQPPHFIKKFDKDKSKEKFDYMYNRIQGKKAKELAKHLYENALKILELK